MKQPIDNLMNIKKEGYNNPALVSETGSAFSKKLTIHPHSKFCFRSYGIIVGIIVVGLIIIG